MSGSDEKRAAATATTEGGVRVVGAGGTPLRDLYFVFLQARWPVALGLLVTSYLGLNALFALLFLAFGGVANARPGSFADAFHFSIQTMGTIGYGAMYPVSPMAHALVAAESVCGLVVTALVTGLVFAKFSRSSARIIFTRQAVISPMEGVPTLMFRISNERANMIVEAQLRVSIVRTEHTREGMVFYRMHDLALSRDRSQAFTRSWTALHPIVPGSPLHDATPRTLAEQEVEVNITIVGIDETSMQPVHARHRYLDSEILWGARHADILSEEPGGDIVLDMTRFHDVVATTPTDEFPYPRGQ